MGCNFAEMKVSLGMLLWAPMLAQEGILKEIPAAFDAARRSQKPLFIYFSAIWCGPCRWVEKKILPNDQFVALTDSFIRLKVMAASGEHSTPGGDSLAKLYKVSAYPTFVLAEPDGQPYYTWVGLRGNDESEALDNLKWHLARAALYRIGEKPPDSLAIEPHVKPFSAASALEHLKTVVHRADTASFPQALEEYLRFFPDWCAAWSISEAQDVIKRLPMKGEYFRRWVWQHLDTLAQSLPEYAWEALREALIWTAYDSLCEKVGFPQCATLIRVREPVYAALLPSAPPLLAKKYIAHRLLEQRDLKARWEGALLLIEFAEATYPPRTFIAEGDSIEAFIDYLGLMEIAEALSEACPDTALLRIPVRWLESATQLAPQLPLFWQTLAQMHFYLHDKESARVACQRARQTNQEHVGVVYGFFSFSFSLGEEFEREIQRLCQRIEALPGSNHPMRGK